MFCGWRPRRTSFTTSSSNFSAESWSVGAALTPFRSKNSRRGSVGSTCDCAVAPADSALPDIPGICGIVNGSIMPDYFGIEAGQSAVGDILKWWVETICGGLEAPAATTI